MTTSVTAVAVVVPVHNEEESLTGCLRAIFAARDRLWRAAPSLDVVISVVLDRCTDHSLQIASGFDVETLVLDEGRVGAARRAGVELARDRLALHAADQVLTLHTDADSIVPSSWLIDHHDLSRRHELVVGRVVPDPVEIDERRRVLWHRLHPEGAPSVHGANLAIRLSLYDRIGGFDTVPAHEDRLLVTAAIRAGAVWTVATMVTTSARLTGRAPEGFASYLRSLDPHGSVETPSIPQSP